MKNNQISKILTKRNIFILLGLVIILEVFWATSTLLKTSSPSPQVAQPVKTLPKPTVITLQTSNTQVKVGEKFTVDINLSSDKITYGIDLIILYDPKVLTVVPFGSSSSPVKLSTLYDDYPVNKIDATIGKITVSGISNEKSGRKANGLFGSIIFQAKSASSTKISLDFTPNSTVDTNVIETSSGGDILEQVNNLQVNVVQ